MANLYEFKECPICHQPGTVCQQVCSEEPNAPKDQFVSLEKIFTPLQDASKAIGPFIKGIMVHYDVCASCGTRYCTRSEVINASTQQMQLGRPGIQRRN